MPFNDPYDPVADRADWLDYVAAMTELDRQPANRRVTPNGLVYYVSVEGDELTHAYPPEVWERIEALAAQYQPSLPIAEWEPASGPPTNSRGVSAAETNLLVGAYLAKHAKRDPDAITVRAIARAVGVSTGAVAQSPSWMAFFRCRRERRPRRPRTTQFIPGLLATIPDYVAADRDEQNALIASQTRDRRADDRLTKRQRPRS